VKIDFSDSDFNFLSVEEVFAVERAAKSEQEAALYVVAAFTGLRFGELRALRFRDVDFVNAAIRVRRNLPVGATKEKGRRAGSRVRCH
jgi:integrase